MYMYPFSSKLPSHPGCHITPSRVPRAVQQVLVGYPFKIQQWVHGVPWWLSDKESVYNAKDEGLVSGLVRPLEKEMATHSNILGWKTPWTEEPGGLLSLGSQSWTQLSN